MSQTHTPFWKRTLGAAVLLALGGTALCYADTSLTTRQPAPHATIVQHQDHDPAPHSIIVQGFDPKGSAGIQVLGQDAEIALDDTYLPSR